MTRPLPIVVLVLSALACGDTRSLASRVPADNEIPGWKLDGAPSVADSDTKLYNVIDGDAPKYIDRGWVASVYATYQGTSLVQVAIHDMGSSDNALALYTYELPSSRVQIGDLPNAVVDTSLPAAYSAFGHAGRYVIEVSIDDRSDSALDTVQRFVQASLQRCE
jgi:hypothetical protein